MANAGRIQVIDTGRSNLRFQFAALLVALGLVMVFITVRFQTKEYLIATPAESRAEHGYGRLWFDNADTLVGATRQGSIAAG